MSRRLHLGLHFGLRLDLCIDLRVQRIDICAIRCSPALGLLQLAISSAQFAGQGGDSVGLRFNFGLRLVQLCFDLRNRVPHVMRPGQLLGEISHCLAAGGQSCFTLSQRSL